MTEKEVESQIERNLRNVTGKKHVVKAERLPTRYNTYASFKITCICADPSVFDDADVWPNGILSNWWKRRSESNQGQHRKYRR